MTRLRLLANIAVGIVLAAIPFGLVTVILDERLSKQLGNVDPTNEVQAIPFAGGNK